MALQINLISSFKARAMNNKQPTKLDLLGACVLGAILGAFLAYGAMGGF